MAVKRDPRSGARSVARKLAMQALYRWQLNESPWQDLVNDFQSDEDMARADGEYFREILQGIGTRRVALDDALENYADRKVAELDPVEHGILWIGLFELEERPDVPWRVVVNEAVTLTRKYGATDAHKYVNAVLDKAARTLRPHES
ncbi:MAG: transcription antitermination factor NusB [Steroidobacteraceae bacterium]